MMINVVLDAATSAAQSYANSALTDFEAFVTIGVVTVAEALLFLMKGIFLLIIGIGFLARSTRLNKREGDALIYGGIALGVFAWAFPLLSAWAGSG